MVAPPLASGGLRAFDPMLWMPELRGLKGRAKTRSRRPPAYPLPVIAGLDGSPATNSKRLAYGRDKDNANEDADTDRTQTTSLVLTL